MFGESSPHNRRENSVARFATPEYEVRSGVFLQTIQPKTPPPLRQDPIMVETMVSRVFMQYHRSSSLKGRLGNQLPNRWFHYRGVLNPAIAFHRAFVEMQSCLRT